MEYSPAMAEEQKVEKNSSNETSTASGLRGNKKFRLWIIGILLVIVAILFVFWTKARIALAIAFVALLAAFGLTASNNDWNLNSIFSGSSVKDAKIQTDQKGNLKRDASGNFVTRVMRDKLGNVVPTGQTGAKYTDEYNCSDFSTQPEAQAFYDKAGGVKGDVNRLDANKDGVPCQSLPKGK
jgi:hypothetical protein